VTHEAKRSAWESLPDLSVVDRILRRTIAQTEIPVNLDRRKPPIPSWIMECSA
jgi:hypothetical protein